MTFSDILLEGAQILYLMLGAARIHLVQLARANLAQEEAAVGAAHVGHQSAVVFAQNQLNCFQGVIPTANEKEEE